MTDFFQTLLKSLVAIAVLFLLARVMGKKQISQLTFFDYVVGISIGSIASSFASEPDVGYMHGLVSMAVFALFPIILSVMSQKSYKARKLLDGKPSILIQNGKIIEENLKKAKLTINDLLEECRLKDAFIIQDIDYAIFETSGKLSILMKPAQMPVTAQDMNLLTTTKGICTNLIVDGKLLEDNIAILNIDRSWLWSELEKLHVSDPASLILCCIDSNRQIYAYERRQAAQTAPIM
jgi:uncharacterized membrane protein YcaP (DUF421 family)